MPIRNFDTDFWGWPTIQPLSKDAKYLYIYLWTNEHCKASGVYRVTPVSIFNDTGIPVSDLPGLFNEIEAKVKWYPNMALVWVKNFIYRQSKSPKFIQAASKSLTELNLNGIAMEVVDYNRDTYTLLIPYPYRIHGVSIVTGGNQISNVDDDWPEEKKQELARVATLYEENIGMLTPLLADRLKDIVEEYPATWFELACREATGSNVRNLKYIERILARWSVDGVKTGLKKDSEKTGKTEKRKFTDV